MVEFGKKMISSQHGPWAEHYLDYSRLKKALKVLSMDRSEAETVTGIKAEIKLEMETQNDPQYFRHLLDSEVEKVVLFYLREQGSLASRLSTLRERQKHILQGWIRDRHGANILEGGAAPALLDLSSEYRTIGHDLIRFVRFAELNATGLRKILKKHDKIFKDVPPLTDIYLSQYSGEGDSHLEQLYNYDGIAALVTTIRRGLRESNFEMPVITAAQIKNGNEAQESDNARTTYQTMALQNSQIYESKLSSLSYQSEDDIEEWGEPVLEAIEIARLRLSQSTRYATTLATQALISLEDPESEEDYTDIKLLKRKKAASSHSPISSFLNLVSTFLYMTNYYIVAPTSGMYAARLGSTEALSGIIIGMTPWAALVSSVLYSWWANHSYKSALIFAAGCSLTGNVLYAFALPCDSLTMVIVARLLNGFGGARAINRRYIADVFYNRERTAASVAFVTAGALGMAVGPGVAAIVGFLDIEEGVYWTEETAPGWIMFVAWTTFFVSAIFFFEEPEKIYSKKTSSDRKEGKGSLEMEPLVSNVSDKGDDESSTGAKKRKASGFTKSAILTYVPVITTLVIYLLLKLALECILSSAPSITSFYFDWNATRSGSFLAVLGVLMFPANYVLARLSRYYSDRYLMIANLILLIIGLFGILFYGSDPNTYTVVQYVIFGVVIFLSTNMLEGVNMSLLSKTIPKSWAVGTFNAGLLATEAGTLGRALGDVVISATAMVGFDKMLNLTFAPLGVLSVITTAVTWKLYTYLDPASDSDEED